MELGWEVLQGMRQNREYLQSQSIALLGVKNISLAAPIDPLGLVRGSAEDLGSGGKPPMSCQSYSPGRTRNSHWEEERVYVGGIELGGQNLVTLPRINYPEGTMGTDWFLEVAT